MASASMFVLPMVLLATRAINVNDEPNKTIILGVFGVVVATMLSIYAYVYWVVSQKNDQTQLVVPPEPLPFGMANPEPPKSMTVVEYDVSEVKKLAQRAAMMVVISGFVVYQFQSVQPMLIQTVMGLQGLVQSKLILVHLLGYPATGAYARPWKADNPLGNLMGGGEAAAAPAAAAGNDTAAITDAATASSGTPSSPTSNGNGNNKKKSKKTN